LTAHATSECVLLAEIETIDAALEGGFLSVNVMTSVKWLPQVMKVNKDLTNSRVLLSQSQHIAAIVR
jgi:hypothetical protein